MASALSSQTRHYIKLIDSARPALDYYEKVYIDLHQHPELSRQEIRTAKIAADHLRSLSVFAVHEGIGGHGVVGVFENGSGPKVLLRADMDALPVKEQTGLEYASTKKGVDQDRREVNVMHACGHDMHVAPLMAVATTLASLKDSWKGTLIVLFQPAEELASGAQAMVDDGLFDKRKWNIPVPDIVLGQHVLLLKSGTIGIAPGPIFAAVDSLSVRVFGRGGHGTRPDLCIDPVLTAAHIVVRLQSVMSREVKPGEMAVLTCGSIQGGDASNVIPPYADIKLTVRSYQPSIHDRVMKAVHRVIQAECTASGCDKPPEINTIMHAPGTVNSIAETEKLTTAFETHFGSNCTRMEPNPGSEDFSVLARSINKPYVFWLFGGVDEEVWDKAVEEDKVSEIPYNHSPFYAPVIQPTLRTGVDALSLAALTFLDGEVRVVA